MSKEVYSELSRFDPIGAGFMLSLDDDGYFTVSSDPRVSHTETSPIVLPLSLRLLARSPRFLL